MEPGSKDYVFRARILEILDALALQWPSMSVRVEFWRLAVVSTTDDFSDKQIERWIRLGENVPAFRVSSTERWYQKEEGIIHQNSDWVYTPALYNLEPDDHIVIDGEPWMITEVTERAGITKLKIDRVKSRFKVPVRTDSTYRQVTVRAKIT